MQWCCAVRKLLIIVAVLAAAAVEEASSSSVEFLEEHYPEIVVIKNEVNSGFSATCNVGIAKASKELMLILNSDIKLTPNYFDNQWQCFEDEDTFIFNQKLHSFDQESILKILDYQKRHKCNNTELARHFKISRNTVASWKKRFV